jgi:hypothetical protein
MKKVHPCTAQLYCIMLKTFNFLSKKVKKSSVDPLNKYCCEGMMSISQLEPDVHSLAQSAARIRYQVVFALIPIFRDG